VVDQRLHEPLVAEDTAVDDLVGHGRRHAVVAALGAGARLDLGLPHDVIGRLDVELLGSRLDADTLSFALAVRAMLVGLTAKSAILIVEFAKAEFEKGRSILDAALEGAGLRLRPILTSLAFIFGCIPLWVATGAGAAARRMLGTAVVSGMLAATLLGIFFIPALFVAVERLTSRKGKHAGGSGDAGSMATPRCTRRSPSTRPARTRSERRAVGRQGPGIASVCPSRPTAPQLFDKCLANIQN